MAASNGHTTYTNGHSTKRNGHLTAKLYSTNDHNTFIQKDNLPKLPVPKLQNSLDKYLSLLKTVLNPQQYSKTRFLVDEFCKNGGLGEKLQQYLLQQHDRKDNWSYECWMDDMYLFNKMCLPVNSNPGGLFPQQVFKNQTDHLGGLLKPEKASHSEKGQLLCMDQWYRFLNCYRRPGLEKDESLTDIGSARNNIIVIYRNSFFKLNCGDIGTVPLISNVVERLMDIVDIMDNRSEEAPPVGILTTTERSQWATARSRLLKDPVNETNIKHIESACLVLCLDKRTVPSHDEDDELHVITCLEHLLHGQGSQVNTGNRWFDCCFQLIVTENGVSGFNYEHSVCEGMPVIDFCEHALIFEESLDNVTSRENVKLSKPIELGWNVSTETLDDIQVASQQIDGAMSFLSDIDLKDHEQLKVHKRVGEVIPEQLAHERILSSLISDLHLSVLDIDTFGREFPKSYGMSPDSFIQLALQLTYYKIHGRLASTYESASLRRFRYGRVDNIRANSQSALQFVRAMVGEWDTTDEDRFALMKDAILTQSNHMKDAIQGYGIDLHILGLREAAKELDIPVPSIFTDDGYNTFNYFKLSTSQVATRNMIGVCYGAVVPDGYGVCYNPKPNSFYAVVTSFRRCPDTDSAMFANSLEASLLQMQGLCERCRTIIDTSS